MANTRMRKFSVGLVWSLALIPLAVLEVIVVWGLLRYGVWAAVLGGLAVPPLAWASVALEDRSR